MTIQGGFGFYLISIIEGGHDFMHSAILDEPFIRIAGFEERIVMLMVDGLRRIRFVDRKSTGRCLSRGPANRGSRASSTTVSPFKI
jgi:hypothetical protein